MKIMENKRVLIIFLLSLFLIFAWSPWITKDYAESRVISVFEDSQKEIADGCGFNCEGCGVVNSRKVPFGYSIDIEYGCGFGFNREDSTKFVSFLGVIIPDEILLGRMPIQ